MNDLLIFHAACRHLREKVNTGPITAKPSLDDVGIMDMEHYGNENCTNEFILDQTMKASNDNAPAQA